MVKGDWLGRETNSQGKKVDKGYEIKVYKDLFDQVSPDIERVEFWIANLPPPNKYYTSRENIIKFSPIEGERYILQTNDLDKVIPKPPKSLFKTDERLVERARQKQKAKAARDAEANRFKIKTF